MLYGSIRNMTHPKTRDGRAFASDLCLVLGKPKLGITLLEKTLDTPSVNGAEALLRSKLGAAYCCDLQFDKARKQFSRSANIERDQKLFSDIADGGFYNHWALTSLTERNIGLNHPQLVYSTAVIGNEFFPKEKYFAEYIGMFFYCGKQYKQALEWWEKSIEIAPNDPLPRYNSACALVKIHGETGRTKREEILEGVYSYLTEAAELDPTRKLIGKVVRHDWAEGLFSKLKGDSRFKSFAEKYGLR